MTDSDKTKEELIKELQNLQQENDSLRLNHDNFITKHSQAEKALRESEENYRNLLELAPDAFFQGNEKGNIIMANKKASLLTNYTKDELLTMNMKDFFLPSTLNQKPLRYDLLDRGETVSIEREVTRKDGSIVFVEMNSRKMPNNTYQSFMRDITERKMAEEALRESEEKFRNIFNESPIGIELYDASGMQINANQASLDMFGIPNVSEVQSFNIYDGTSLNDEKKEKLRRGESITYQAVFDFDKVAKYQQFTTHKSGKAYFDYIITPLLNREKKDISGYLLQVQDISQHKLAEIELLKAKQIAEENEAKYSSIVKILPDGVIIHTNGIIVYANESAIKILKGQNQEDYLGKPAISFVHPDYRDLALQRIRKSIIEKTSAEMVDEVFIDSEGNPVNVLVTGIPFQYQRQPSMLTVFTDITKIKETEQELIKAKESAEESEEIFNQFMRHSPIYVFFKDAEIRPMRLSHNYEKMIGMPISEMLGKTMFELFPSDLAKNMVADDLKILQEGKVFEIEEEHNGRYYSTIKFPVHMKGKPRFLAGFTLDITERKQSELLLKEKNEELIRAKEKAEESDRLKSAFLANMSHEIRTPMNGILGFADLLKKPQLTGEQQQNYISIIETSGARMLNIINDIIDISKIESGETKVSISETNINEQINHILSFFNPEAEHKGLLLFHKSALPNKDAIIRTDCEKLFAILTNLVKNAIKFTDKGSVEIGYVNKDEFLEFYVKDTGIGIPKNRQQAVFERFVQADVSDSRAFQGAGLGLAITKAYVEMLDGQIWFESEEQKGSVFYFTIPNSFAIKEQIVNKVLPKDKSISLDKRLKVLVAEDDEPSDLYITLLLDNYPCDVLHARTGVEAVEMCRKNPDLDLILMDIKMPLMNGYEATQQIRQFNNKVIIFAQTAYALAGDKEKAIEVGCNQYLPKPLSQSLFRELIQAYFNK